MEHFDQELQIFSHRITLLRLIKNQITLSPQQLFKQLMESDRNKKGYYEHNQIISLWLNHDSIDQKMKITFMQHCFLMKQISYSILSCFILSNEPNSYEQKNTREIKQINDCIKQIFNLELLNYISRLYISQNISKTIPTTGTLPTKNQFQQYVICRQLAVDVEAVSKSLKLPLMQANVPVSKQSNNLPKRLENIEVQNIQKIMNRLKQKVNNFGGQWLK